ncbi:MAG: UbiA-like polyprenyltransferase [Thermodesulfobacteriota bacterium]
MDFKTFSKLIMIEQTLFALPFALLGVLFAGGGTFGDWVWVAVALAAARTAGMSFNRVIDADIDAKNPRTAERALPKGDVSRTEVWLTALAACLIFVFAAWMLNPLCFYLSFAGVFLLFTYSFFKRFSSSSHFYLGLIEAAAPIGGFLAVTGEFAFLPFVLGFIILAWIAGLDIVYALQDLEFDRGHGLHSLPVTLGKERALQVSALCYGGSIAAMILAGLMSGQKGPYWTGLIAIAAIFVYQQTLARKPDIKRASLIIFKINGWVAPILLAGALMSYVVK